MADKKYKINFEMTDGSTQSVEFTSPQGEKGDTGTAGKTAYQYAQDGGYTGTEQEFAEKLASNSGYSYPCVLEYGAKGDGAANDTTAFQNALTENRVVFVPGGTYKLNGTLVIRENCCLELSQDTVLEFTQTSGNCIEMRGSATLRGNHAVIRVPYAFTGNVIDVNTIHDTTRGIPPYAHFDPMWKRGRFIYDVCIVKPTANGLHYSLDGTCSGKAIYMSCDGTAEVGFIWGATLQGIRIGGAFTHGIHVINFDDPNDSMEDDAWNHDMRIEAVIQGCETGVALQNCNGTHLAVAIQPSSADNGTHYAKWGVYLNDCRFVDMMSSYIWDWQAARSDSAEYTHIAMYGNCRGLVLSDPRYYEGSADVRDIIYTDTPSNLERMTILQEPITRWFNPVEGQPYFNDGHSNKPLMLREEMNEYFTTDRVKGYTDVLATSINADGSIYNEVGYRNKGGYYNSSWDTETASTFYFTTGFIPVKAGDTLRGDGLAFSKKYDSNCRITLFNSQFATESGWTVSAGNMVNHTAEYFVKYSEAENGFEIFFQDTDGQWPVNANLAYARLQFHRDSVGEYPVMSVNEEIKFTVEGFLSDGIKVKGANVIGGTGGSGGTAEQSDWNAAEGEPGHVLNRTHYTEQKVIVPETTLECNDDNEGYLDLTGQCTIVAGKTYTVTYNGVSYTRIAVACDDDMVGLGNLVIDDDRAENTGEPFLLLWGKDFCEFLDKSFSDGEYSTVTFMVTEEAVEKIPPKYLPEGVGYAENEVLFQENTLAYDSGLGAFLVPNFLPMVGETYTVTYNGTAYTVTAFKLNTANLGDVIGMGNSAAVGGTDTGEPFAIGYIVASGATVCIPTDGSETIVLEISGEVVHKVPDKYLPKTFHVVNLIDAGLPTVQLDNAAELPNGEAAGKTAFAIWEALETTGGVQLIFERSKGTNETRTCEVFAQRTQSHNTEIGGSAEAIGITKFSNDIFLLHVSAMYVKEQPTYSTVKITLSPAFVNTYGSHLCESPVIRSESGKYFRLNVADDGTLSAVDTSFVFN